MISQREARRLRKRVTLLEALLRDQRSRSLMDYPRGVNIASDGRFTSQDNIPVAIRTARKCGHVVVVTERDNGDLYYYALPHPQVPA